MESLIEDNLSKIKDKIRPGVRILFATKYASPEDISLLARIESRILIGENRVQDAEEKMEWIRKNHPELADNMEVHMIGHLQSNKARKAVQLFDCIQSVDSIKLAEKISSAAKEEGKIMPVYLEINISGEKRKFGFPPDEAEDAFRKISKMGFLSVRGIMGIAPNIKPEYTRKYFQSLRKMADKFGVKTSMGMSNDFEVAMEEGSDMIRLGRIIFSY
ncbi:MAG: YggS family pyridoxal phosphate-dependent enzyme [Candidatus Aenigmarchaeota archaeon]|nr:YggS family pyridoxal phosphate-dependent enzyme [Candidatus Aenigmarchaeota archaeon]